MLRCRRPDLKLFDEAESIFSSLDKDRSGVLSFAEVRRSPHPLAVCTCDTPVLICVLQHSASCREISHRRQVLRLYCVPVWSGVYGALQSYHTRCRLRWVAWCTPTARCTSAPCTPLRHSLYTQVVRLWCPYFTLHECAELAAKAPSANAPPAEEALPGSTWQEEDIAAMQREFGAMDVSGDGTVDRHVRLRPLWCFCTLPFRTPPGPLFVGVSLCCRVRTHLCSCVLRNLSFRCATRRAAPQEFTQAMLRMWGLTPRSAGFRKTCRMVSGWFDDIDADGSGEIDFAEFEGWYRRTVGEARALRRADSLDDDVGGIEGGL